MTMRADPAASRVIRAVDNSSLSHQGRTRRSFLRQALGLAGVALLSGCGSLPASGTSAPRSRHVRIGYLDLARKPPASFAEFTRQLRELGYEEGKNLSLEQRYAEENSDRLREEARNLAELNLDVIVAFGTQASRAAKDATVTNRTPIVMSGSDPVGAGLVKSLDEPGGNVTGLASGAVEVAGKRLELLRDLLPNVERIGALLNPGNPGDDAEWAKSEEAAKALGVRLVPLEARTKEAISEAFKKECKKPDSDRAQALVCFASSLLNANSRLIVDLARDLDPVPECRRPLPGIYPLRQYVEEGGLMAYGPDWDERYRRAAEYVDKILRGTPPGTLPIDRARRFKLVLNQQVARELELTIPRALRVQVDEVL